MTERNNFEEQKTKMFLYKRPVDEDGTAMEIDDAKGFEKIPWEPTAAAMTAAEEGMTKNHTIAVWYPFLSLLQLATKTEDAILYQKTNVTQELGLPAFCEVFCMGKNIKNRLKKSRPMSMGPLAHLYNLYKLHNSDRPPTDANGKPVPRNILVSIEERYITWVKEQSISQVQKRIVDQIHLGYWTLLPTLAVSYLAIKPHIEHHFVLIPEVIAVTDNFQGANFTNEWVFRKFEESFAKMTMMGPVCAKREETNAWQDRIVLLKALAVFQC